MTLEQITETFYATVRDSGSSSSMEVTIDHRVAKVMGLKIGDKVKILIKKVPGE